ncbi:DUF4102 domain-containing protein [Corticibacter populi]|uniref:DUF4102 domain-containing protein n=1 Tax=Corticibacter populi TaxID=1550736 RepID=A0A3M6QVC9_9BURK|nr:integrase family protein [Corticibacter populi]RMX06831.1 DUF4102 domain-containing protein [Corticibacter populi]RZS31577.1 uncharacterized protein DUF4102 [Corticibacter populi]
MARPKKTESPDLAERVNLTAGAIARLRCPVDGKTQAFLRDSEVPALRVRVTSNGAKSFVFERKLNRQTIRLTIGDVHAWSIEQARTEARRLAVMIDAGIDPREVARQKQAEQQRLRQQAQACERAAQFTLARLLDAYCHYLKDMGRSSHADARSIFNLHVKSAWPEIAAMPAREVTSEQVAAMMRKLIEAGKARTANKLRAYMRSAYQIAKAAKSKPSIPVAFMDYGIVSNPVADTAPDEAANRPDKRPLTAQRLREYWRAICAVEGFKGALLRVHLLTGGQRIAQFVRLRTADISAESILLYDTKGRPGHPPRPHVVPLTAAAAKALAECEPAGEWAFSTDGGHTHVAPTTLSHWAAQAAGERIPGFQAKRLRSGVETLLASARVAADIRGRIQSHGITGVQARHYDGHEYMDEKLEALQTLYRLLTQPQDGNG